MLGAVAGDLHVLGHGQHHIIPGVLYPVAAQRVPLVLHLAAEADLLGLVHLGDEPGVAQPQPVVGQLHLLAVHDLLLEDAQLVADGVACGGDLQGGHGVQVAGGQAAQAAVAKSRVPFQGTDAVQILSKLRQAGTDYILNTQVKQVVIQ